MEGLRPDVVEDDEADEEDERQGQAAGRVGEKDDQGARGEDRDHPDADAEHHRGLRRQPGRDPATTQSVAARSPPPTTSP